MNWIANLWRWCAGQETGRFGVNVVVKQDDCPVRFKPGLFASYRTERECAQESNRLLNEASHIPVRAEIGPEGRLEAVRNVHDRKGGGHCVDIVAMDELVERV